MIKKLVKYTFIFFFTLFCKVGYSSNLVSKSILFNSDTTVTESKDSSLIYNDKYLLEKDSYFYIMSVTNDILFKGEFFDLDLDKFKMYTEISNEVDKGLIIRVIDLSQDRTYPDVNGTVYLERQILFSRLLLNRPYYTKLFIEGKLSP